MRADSLSDVSGRHRRERKLPAHEQDQVDAAVSEVMAGMFHTALMTGKPLEMGENDDPRDPTLTAWIAGMRAGVERREVRACEHVIRTVQPIYVNAWDQPLTMRCYPCQAVQPKPVGDDDLRCDTCGVIDRTGLWPMQMALGAIVISIGRCDACVPEHLRQPH